MAINQRIFSFVPAPHLTALCRRLVPALVASLTLTLVGCGGSSSSSNGGAAFSTGPATVSGNVSGAGGALARHGFGPAGADQGALVRLLDTLVAQTHADDHLSGIEVCISDICTLTDAEGNFVLITSSLPAGMYSLRILVGGVIYTYDLTQEIDGTTSVLITDMVISESGTVNVGDISYEAIEEDEMETDIPAPLVDEPGKPEEGSISGNISSAPENTGSGGQNRIVICHKPGTPAEKTLIVAEPATRGHLGHGDTLGACDGNSSGGADSPNGNDDGEHEDDT